LDRRETVLAKAWHKSHRWWGGWEFTAYYTEKGSRTGRSKKERVRKRTTIYRFEIKTNWAGVAYLSLS